MSQQGDEASGQKREIAGFYSRVASTYDAIGPAVFSRLDERVVTVAGIDAGARVLDVAAGRGANLFPAAKQVGPTGQVIGIDLASAMVAQTARHSRAWPHQCQHATDGCRRPGVCG